MIDDLDGPQFCSDYGYCICGNDCMKPEEKMTKYVSIPTVIEAVRFTYDDATFEGTFPEVNEFAGRRDMSDIRVGEKYPESTYNIVWDESREGGEVFDKLHQTWINFKNGDWIIRGTKGELYPCDNEVFEAKYRLLTEEVPC